MPGYLFVSFTSYLSAVLEASLPLFAIQDVASEPSAPCRNSFLASNDYGTHSHLVYIIPHRYIHIYIYIHISIYIYTHIYIYINITCIPIYIYDYIQLYTYIFTYMFILISKFRFNLDPTFSLWICLCDRWFLKQCWISK